MSHLSLFEEKQQILAKNCKCYIFVLKLVTSILKSNSVYESSTSRSSPSTDSTFLVFLSQQRDSFASSNLPLDTRNLGVSGTSVRRPWPIIVRAALATHCHFQEVYAPTTCLWKRKQSICYTLHKVCHFHKARTYAVTHTYKIPAAIPKSNPTDNFPRTSGSEHSAT